MADTKLETQFQWFGPIFILTQYVFHLKPDLTDQLWEVTSISQRADSE
jgi:hypothetical protein